MSLIKNISRFLSMVITIIDKGFDILFNLNRVKFHAYITEEKIDGPSDGTLLTETGSKVDYLLVSQEEKSLRDCLPSQKERLQ